MTKIAHFHEYETIGVSVAIERWKSPKTAGPPFRSSEDITRVADDGVAGELRLFQRQRYDLVRVRLDPAWRVVAQMAGRAGYSAEISDKGRQAIAILNLIEDPQDLALLASSKVYGLLRDMARIVPRQAVQQAVRRQWGREPSASEVDCITNALEAGTIDGGQFERPHYSGDQLRTALGVARQDATWLVEWLARCRFLFRGYHIDCPECGLPRCYPVDRLAAMHLCDGCQTTMPLPLPVDKPLVWRYRLNEVVALGVDQGVLPHLLALRRIMEWGYRIDAPLLGVVPGLTLTPLSQDGPPKIEVDLFAVHDGRIVVVECKANGSELAATEVERFAALGKRLDCSRIVYATPSTFSEVGETTELASSVSVPISVELWEAPDMLDPRPHESVPQLDPIAYLHNLFAWRRSDSD